MYAWRLENQWHYLLIDAGFLAGFITVNLAIVRAAGYTVERPTQGSGALSDGSADIGRLGLSDTLRGAIVA